MIARLARRASPQKHAVEALGVTKESLIALSRKPSLRPHRKLASTVPL